MPGVADPTLKPQGVALEVGNIGLLSLGSLLAVVARARRLRSRTSSSAPEYSFAVV